MTLAACATASLGGPDGAGGDDDDPDGSALIADAPPPGTPDAPAPGTPDARPPADAPPPPPIDAAACDPCTLVPQCGCGGGEACDLDGTMLPTGGTECRPVTAPGMGTSTCTGVTTCAAGWVCLGGAGSSSCKEFCQSDAQCDGEGGICVIQITYGSPPMDVPGAKVCSQNCTVVSASPAGCPATWGCHVYQNPDDSRFFTWCTPAGGGGQEAACTYDEDCQVGYSCINAGGNKCLKNCNVTAGTGCSGLAGASCLGFATPAVIAGVEYGVCWDGT